MAPITRSQTTAIATKKQTKKQKKGRLSSRKTTGKKPLPKTAVKKPTSSTKPSQRSKWRKAAVVPAGHVRCGERDYIFYITPDDLERKIKAWPDDSWRTVSTWDGVTNDLELKYGKSLKNKRGEHEVYEGELLPLGVNLGGCTLHYNYDPALTVLMDQYAEEMRNAAPIPLPD